MDRDGGAEFEVGRHHRQLIETGRAAIELIGVTKMTSPDQILNSNLVTESVWRTRIALCAICADG